MLDWQESAARFTLMPACPMYPSARQRIWLGICGALRASVSSARVHVYLRICAVAQNDSEGEYKMAGCCAEAPFSLLLLINHNSPQIDIYKSISPFIYLSL